MFSHRSARPVTLQFVSPFLTAANSLEKLSLQSRLQVSACSESAERSLEGKDSARRGDDDVASGLLRIGS